jgi:hypothetical protein
MRFLPKSQASTDHDPGPIIARVSPRVASKTDVSVLFLADSAIHASAPVTNAQANGVHNPAIRKMPPSAKTFRDIAIADPGVPFRQVKAK